jgi:hypothetical protein
LFKSVTGKTHFAYFKTILYIVYHTETSLVNEFDILLSKAEGGMKLMKKWGFPFGSTKESEVNRFDGEQLFLWKQPETSFLARIRQRRILQTLHQLFS